MMTPLLLIAALTPLARQEITPAKHTPLTVPSLDFGVEARVSGTVLQHEGKPAQGARVSLFHQFYGWNGGYETLATTVTDSDGKFVLQDLRYRSGDSYLKIQVDEHHAVLTEPVPLATGGTCHVGELQAMALTVLEGTVSFEASLDSDPSKRRGIQLLDEETQRVAGYCWIEDGRFRITGFPKKPLSLRFLEGKSLITQRVDFTERPTVSQVHLQISADEIVLSAISPEVAMTDESRESTALAGIIVDAMGDPLPGLEVRAYPQDWRVPQSDPGSIAITDETGAFRLTIRDFEPVRLWVYSPLGAARVEFKPVGRNYSREVITVEPASESMQIQLKDAKRLDLPPTLPNAHGNDVPVAYFGFGASGWRPVDHQSAGIRLGELHRTIMAHIPGRFPRAISPSRYPRSGLDGVDQEELRTLRVHSNGRPVPGAKVHLKQTLGNLEAPFPSEVLLRELNLDDQGQFVGYAPKGVHYVAIVTAPGCSPQTVTLFGERTVEVQLNPLPPAITLAGAQPGQSIVIQSAINGQTLWTQRRIAQRSQALSASLPPGQYDLILLDENSEVVAGQTFSVRQDQEAQTLQVDQDSRAQLRLTLPSPPTLSESQRAQFADWYDQEIPEVSEWNAWVTREIGPGGPSGAAAMTYGSSGPRFDIPAGKVIRDGHEARIITFHGSGDFWINLTDIFGQMPGTFMHEWTVRPDAPTTLHLPELSATLRGSMFKFRGDLGFSHHGVAGPRLWIGSPIEAGRRTGWNVSIFLPDRDGKEEDNFTVPHLPPGKYWIQNHLHTGSLFARGAEIPIGALQTTLAAGSATTIPDFGAPKTRNTSIRVQFADGTPFTEGHIRHVDPMHTAWAEFTKQPTTGVYADSPIPAPVSFPLDEEGVATLYGVRYETMLLDLQAFEGWTLRAALETDEEATTEGPIIWTIANR